MMVLRDKNGVMRMVLADRTVSQLMVNNSGKWRPRTTLRNITDSVYEITVSLKLTTPTGDELYLWEGDILCNEERG